MEVIDALSWKWDQKLVLKAASLCVWTFSSTLVTFTTGRGNIRPFYVGRVSYLTAEAFPTASRLTTPHSLMWSCTLWSTNTHNSYSTKVSFTLFFFLFGEKRKATDILFKQTGIRKDKPEVLRSIAFFAKKRWIGSHSVSSLVRCRKRPRSSAFLRELIPQRM